MPVRHFLTLKDCTPDELQHILQQGIALKKTWKEQGDHNDPLKSRSLAMIFEKASTRTRLSFEIAMTQLGGHALFLSPRDTQLGRGEPIEDSARVMSRMADAIIIRTFSHEIVETFAAHSLVPVINALTDDYHPCQLLADMQTWYEHRGPMQGKTVAWIGDGNNMCNSYINAAMQYDFKLRIACPEGFEPKAELLAEAGDRVELLRDAKAAARDADLVVTDVWASMGQEDEQRARMKKFMPFQVNAEVMAQARPDALFMHCLPAHRGEEVTADVIDGPQSVVWDEAENRLHAQKALLHFLLVENRA
ncbi:ornithine carbamoyltransferase [Sulfurivirga caldicuralii]|uniref:Ornithine carbamoyltransferase n=1 Tax=Sulfurivirga caldicuralii TaxID=364032 RepID=A0A1N6DYG5_9GAMM|nr:ornithine carbamoyltransferase [Sulfurivirga caldicuralii]SIN75828.1 ornithine carbamoyltransferase [Sulfurivirga caldicuralii]